MTATRGCVSFEETLVDHYQDGTMNDRPRPAFLQRKIRQGLVILVDAVDTTRTNSGAFDGDDTLPERLADVHVGTVLVRCPVDPAVPPGKRPWQAGRVHQDGVRWEEKTWPRKDFIAFRDHVASLMEFTVPGDVRRQARHLPVVACQEEQAALQSRSSESVSAAR